MAKAVVKFNTQSPLCPKDFFVHRTPLEKKSEVSHLGTSVRNMS